MLMICLKLHVIKLLSQWLPLSLVNVLASGFVTVTSATTALVLSKKTTLTTQVLLLVTVTSATTPVWLILKQLLLSLVIWMFHKTKISAASTTITHVTNSTITASAIETAPDHPTMLAMSNIISNNPVFKEAAIYELNLQTRLFLLTL